MDDECKKLLKDVLMSFLHDPTRFIDDTSVEKLLTWLSTVCSSQEQVQKLDQDWILQFIYDSLNQEKPVVIAFALRLIGILAVWPFYFQRMEDYKCHNLLNLVASIPYQSSWNSASVRDAYLKAANDLLPHRKSFNWIIAKGMCFNCALAVKHGKFAII